jgi:hypothetical protein
MTVSARLALLSLLLAAPVQAQEGRVEIDTNLICNSRQQVERFVFLFNASQGSVETAIDAVNAEQSTPEACVIATTAFRRVGPVATVTNPDATFDVVRIVVVGVYTVNGLERSLPSEFFTLMARDEDATVGQRP